MFFRVFFFNFGTVAFGIFSSQWHTVSTAILSDDEPQKRNNQYLKLQFVCRDRRAHGSFILHAVPPEFDSAATNEQSSAPTPPPRHFGHSDPSLNFTKIANTHDTMTSTSQKAI